MNRYRALSEKKPGDWDAPLADLEVEREHSDALANALTARNREVDDLRRQLAEAVEAERARFVAWLRQRSTEYHFDSEAREALMDAADEFPATGGQ